MTAQVVYTNINGDTDATGSLFADAKFFLSATVPGKATIKSSIESNGGTVVALEKDADIKLVDHIRKVTTDDCFSYQYVERSVRNGQLEDLELHRVGPRGPTSRPVGSIARPGRTMRTAFTADDDRVLLDWITRHPQKSGGTAGNEIFKQLERHNARHPWQSWRDRWVKCYRSNYSFPPENTVPVRANAPPTPPEQPETIVLAEPRPQFARRTGPTQAQRRLPSEHRVVIPVVQHGLPPQVASNPEPAAETMQTVPEVEPEEPRAEPSLRQDQGIQDEEVEENTQDDDASEYEEVEYEDGMSFGEEDEQCLLQFAKHIYNIDPERAQDAWEAFAETMATHHTAKEWQTFWDEAVKPIYLEQKRQRREAGETSSQEDNLDVEEPREARSPSYHPDSPSYKNQEHEEDLASEDVAASDDDEVLIHSIEMEEEDASSVELPTHASVSAARSSKRKRTPIEDNMPQSSPPASYHGRNAQRKRFKLSLHESGKQEILATPEKTTRCYDGGDEENADEEDEEDESNEGETNEDEDDKYVPKGPSPELDYNYQSKIDLQIFRDIASSAVPTSLKDPTPGNEEEAEKTSPNRTREDGSSDEEIDSEDEGQEPPSSLPRSVRQESLDNMGEDEASSTLFLPHTLEIGETQLTNETLPEIRDERSPSVVQTKTRRLPSAFRNVSSPEPLSSPIKLQAPAEATTSSNERPPSAQPNQQLSSLTEPDLNDEEVADQVENFFNSYVNQGVPDEDIDTALRATCMDLAKARIALTSIRAGLGLPKSTSGIWTAWDDANRRSLKNDRLFRVMQKHGNESYSCRLKFLEEYDDD